jgi:hypothetical protein
MTDAQQVLGAWRGQRGGIITVAKQYGLRDHDKQDGITFYYFTDRSILCTKGRGDQFKAWTLFNTEPNR